MTKLSRKFAPLNNVIAVFESYKHKIKLCTVTIILSKEKKRWQEK